VGWSFDSVVIDGERVRLEPLSMDLHAEICRAMIPDPHGWYAVMFGIDNPAAFEKEIVVYHQKYRAARTGMGFAVREKESGEIVGISFFLQMDEENRRLEIGTTIIAPKFRRTHVNTSLKLTMLAHAFEKLKCIRVSFRVDQENSISQKAIERIGAKYGGLLRYERILPDGRIRDYRFYCVIDREWPEVKSKLKRYLNR
jgi:RimJ/RimL family protein N-acetyltransferase